MEISAPWDGSTTGDAEKLAPIDSEEWSDFWATFFSSGSLGDEDRGVFRNYLNELNVTGTTSPIKVWNGGAIVHGRWYRKDGATYLYVSIPTTSTRTDRVVLQCSWSAQTIRVEMLTNPSEGTGTPPALTQSRGITWEIPLATVTVTTGGAITLVDERSFIHVGQHRTAQVFVDSLGMSYTGPTLDPPQSSLGTPMWDSETCKVRGKWTVPADYVKDMEISAIVVTDAAVTSAGYAALDLQMFTTACAASVLEVVEIAKNTRVLFTADDLGILKAAITVRPGSLTPGEMVRFYLEREDDDTGWDNLAGTLWCVGFLATYVSDAG